MAWDQNGQYYNDGYDETQDPYYPGNFDPPPGYGWDPTHEEGPTGGWVPTSDPAPGPPPPVAPPPTGNPTPTPPTPPPPGAPTGDGSGGGGGYSTPSSFSVSDSWPQFHAPALPTIAQFIKRPDFEYQNFAEPAPFSYDSFNAPSIEDARQEPGYEFARSEGERALLNSRLATRRTGGTLKDLIGWGNKFAEQNYGNVYNRAANTYGINRGNAFENFSTNRNNSFQSHQANELGRLGAYTTNFGADKDTYDRNTAAQWDTFDRQFRNSMAEFDPRMTAAQLTFADIYNRDRDKLNSLTNIATAGAGA